ncbi:MAG TPA: class I SAM-dependent methyltransferase [Streptosporangiaceae bacterium]
MKQLASHEFEPGQGPSGAELKPLQLAYSEVQAEMLDEQGRRRKAAKILAVLRHFLGRKDFHGLRVLDIGCSAGFISDELSLAGADVIGLDIDEPGLEKAKQRFGDHVEFILAPGSAIPLPTGSVDVVIFNHIYEHVPDPLAVMAEIRRVLRGDGVVYLGLGNRLGVIEPHYRLPFLSWLPKRLADRYVRIAGQADSYYETFQTRAGLRRLCRSFSVWDYTYAVLTQPERFAADDLVPRRLRGAPAGFWRAMSPVIPTFIWVGSPAPRQPDGPRLEVNPARV